MAIRVTIKDAAKRLGVGEMFVRVGLQTGKLPIGAAVKISSKWSYHVSPGLLDAYCSGSQKITSESEFWED